jgi:hypothetical protein
MKTRKEKLRNINTRDIVSVSSRSWQGFGLGLERLEAVSRRFLKRLGLVMQRLVYIPN